MLGRLLGRLLADEADGLLVLQLLDQARQLFLRHAGHRELHREHLAARTFDDLHVVGLISLVMSAALACGAKLISA